MYSIINRINQTHVYPPIIIMANSKQQQRGMRLIFSVIVLCLAVVLLPGVASQKGRKRQPPTTIDPEVWTFAVGILGTREEYIDEMSGEVRGLNPDTIDAVCRIAGKNCRLVQDPYQNCWTNIEGGDTVGGVGLFNFYYDSCTGWSPTLRRKRTFSFSPSYTNTFIASFAVRSGNPGNFGAEDLTGSTIGFVDGFASNSACVARQAENIMGAALPDANIVIYSSEAAMIQGIIDGKVDAGFNAINSFQGNDDLEIISDGFPCTEGGSAMMTRKDNPILTWFNPALQTLLASQEYRQICDNMVEVHGDIPGPEPQDTCIDY